MSLPDRVIEWFEQRFGEPPALLVRAPGRVNLIGEHTDYNDGFVLPLAIDRATWIALRPHPRRWVRVYSLDFRETAEFSLDQFVDEGRGWTEYVKGIAWVLQEAGFTLRGWEGVMAGDVPIGAGLSSSASLELATARAFEAVSSWKWDAAQMALLAQRAENKWVGVNCGIMDQMISAAGKKDHALLIDCRTLQSEVVPLPPETAVIILDTATRRGLVDSAYNERRIQCETAAHHFGVKALRDVSLAELHAHTSQLTPVTYRRAHHVISENERTLQATAAMHQQDAAALGQLMNASHASLRDDFEVSSPALNTIVGIAQNQPGCYGARMTGAGFGGCAVALVQIHTAPQFADAVSAAYQAATTLQPHIYICQATDGASVIQ